MVNRTIPKCRIQKNAITIRVLHQTNPRTNLAGKFPLKLIKVVFHANSLGNLSDFLLRDPNKPRLWSGATISTLSALEGKPLGIPRKLGRGIFGLGHIVILWFQRGRGAGLN
jgi:hypothetical protein